MSAWWGLPSDIAPLNPQLPRVPDCSNWLAEEIDGPGALERVACTVRFDPSAWLGRVPANGSFGAVEPAKARSG
jgi:hypothetical protein